MTTRGTATVAATRARSTRAGSSITRTAAFLLVAVVVLAEAIAVAECRSFRQDRGQVQRNRRETDETQDYVNDGAPVSDDEEESEVPDESVGGGGSVTPTILTSGLTVETAEGTTVNLPCKVDGPSLDDIAVIWINGTNSIMTDGYASTTDPRIKSGSSHEAAKPGDKFVEHTLVVEQVTRFDSGTYTCRVTSEPPVQITHTLSVIHPAKILTVRTVGSTGSTNTEGAKKLTMKQGEPVQLICNVAGYPEPTVMWTKRAKYQQQPQQQQSQSTQSPGQDQVPSLPQRPGTVVSNTNEVRIDSVVGLRDAGYYECTAHNSVSPSSDTASDPAMGSARSGLDLEIEFPPEVIVSRRVVNTGETATAQLACFVQGFPKVRVTWEKEQTVAGQTAWQPLVAEVANSRLEIFRPPANAAQPSVNTSAVPVGPKYVLKVKQLISQDFGLYRCKAENSQGVIYSDAITLTGSPAQPLPTYVQVITTSGFPELGWNVDSWSPLVEYQLQYKRQQDRETSWTDVKPPPKVAEAPTASSAGDERRFSVSYTFGDTEHQKQTLESGTTYVVRIRARNTHGWSDWSADVVTVMNPDGMEDDQANEIAQQNGQEEKVLKASTTGGASGPQRSYNAVAAIVLAVTVVIATASASVC